MKIAYTSILPANDPRSWSGLNYHIAACLRDQGFEVDLIGPIHSPMRKAMSKTQAVLRQLISRKRCLWTRNTSLLRHYAAVTSQRLSRGKYDLLFSPGTEPIAYLPPQVTLPVVFWTDAPFGAMHDYYPWYQNLSAHSVWEGMESDREALARAALGIYSSEWAAHLAVEKHGADPSRVAVVPFGANLQSRVSESELTELIERRLKPPWHFLFVGVEWERKGGDTALAAVEELNALGFPSELTVVGCQPPARAQPLPDFVKLEGFLDKRSEAGRRRLAELYRSTLFFFMPSQAEAYGIVFCEASAHGVPCLATTTGGIPTIIREGENGYLLPPDALAADYVKLIRSAANTEHYADLVHKTLRAYDERLTWKVSGERLKRLLENVAGSVHTASTTPWSPAVSAAQLPSSVASLSNPV
jgi:glycosyltransferase involved in cell wall biosynthesis